VALIAVRALCKVGVAACSPGLRDWPGARGILVGDRLLPMSAVALLLTRDVAAVNPGLAAQVGGVVIGVVLMQIARRVAARRCAAPRGRDGAN